MPNGQIISAEPENPYTGMGVASKQLLLLDGVTITDPGIWCEVDPFRNGSFEVSGTFTLTAGGYIQLEVSNAPDKPADGYNVAIGGTPTAGDIYSLLVSSPLFFITSGNVPGVVGKYVAQFGDSANDVAAGLRTALTAALLAAARHQIYGENANIVSSVMIVGGSTNNVLITWNSQLPNSALPVSVIDQSASGASASRTITKYDSSVGNVVPGCVLTAPGLVSFNVAAKWMRAVAYLVATGAATAIVMLDLP